MKCYWAEHHVSIDSEGKFRPCCTWRNMGDEPEVTTVEKYFESDFYKKLNKNLSDDLWPKGCEDCMEQESIKEYSMRTEKDDIYKVNPLWKDAEIKFGNLCNLGCVMCSPYNSSLIQDEYIKMKGQHELFNRTTDIKTNWFKDEDNLRSIARSLSNRNELHFSGGEPTVNNYLRIFLDELIKNNCNATLLIRTNANNWPSKMHELMKQFKTKISISIDAHGNENEYIRWPSKWDKTERNVSKILSLPNTQVKLNPTVAAYNVHLLPKLYDWAVDIGIQRYNFDSVYQPHIFAANNSEQWQKDIYKEFANNYKHPLGDDYNNEGPHKVINHVMKKGQGLQEAIDFLKILDYNRKTNYNVLGI